MDTDTRMSSAVGSGRESGLDANPMRARQLSIAANGVAAIAILLELGALLLLVPQPAGTLDSLDGSTIGGYVLGATYPIVGWIIASRRPGNAIGWIFVGIGLSQALDTFAGQYATVGLITAPGSLPGADLLSWVHVWAWAPGFTLLLTLSILLFPDGRLPSPRWRAIPWLSGLAMAMLAIPTAALAWPGRGANLLGPGPTMSSDPLVSTIIAIQFGGLVLLAFLAAASLVGLGVRFRRSRGVERAQLKWFAAAGVIEVIELLVSAFFSVPGFLANLVLSVVLTPLLPVAATIAILRYRLYDIDRIVSRSVAYLSVTGVLVALFAGLVVALQTALAPFTRTNSIAVAASTLAVAASFQPLLRRVRRVVDRRFNRAAFDADREAAGFAGQIRDQADARSVTDALAAALGRTIQPSSARVWLRDPHR
jgi:hypothetical protein